MAIEQAIIRMTTEVGALREQLESRQRFFTTAYNPHSRVSRLLIHFLWRAVRHFAIDFILLTVLLLWLRRKKDRRFEGAIRVLLGDAVAKVQKVGGVSVKTIGRITTSMK